MNIIQFAASIGYPLTKGQEWVLRMFYDLDLSDLPPFYKEALPSSLLEQKKLNHIPGEFGPFRRLLLCAGRRSGKTHILKLIVLYETTAHLKVGCSDTPLSGVLLGMNRNHAHSILRSLREDVEEIPLLRERFLQGGDWEICFQTDKDLSSEHDGLATLRVFAQPQDTRGLILFVGAVDEAARRHPRSLRIEDPRQNEFRQVYVTTGHTGENQFSGMFDEFWDDPQTLCLELSTHELREGIEFSHASKQGLSSLHAGIEWNGDQGTLLMETVPAHLIRQIHALRGASPLEEVVKNALQVWITLRKQGSRHLQDLAGTQEHPQEGPDDA